MQYLWGLMAMVILLATVNVLPIKATGAGQTIFVSPTGNDQTGNGSQAQPYLTLTRAAQDAQPGDTILVRGGEYNAAQENIQRLYGQANAPIIIKPYNGEHPIFDGSSANLSRNESIIILNDARHVILEGLEVRNSGGRGISVYEGEYITIRDNNIHHITSRGLGGGGDHLTFEDNVVWQTVLENENEVKSSGWSAGISTYRRADGSDSTNVIIQGNHVYQSWGEGIIAGYSENTQINKNIVHDTYSLNIYLNAANGATINGNMIFATTNAFNRSDRDYPAHGIGLANERASNSSGAYQRNIRITNNVIVGTGVGINYWQSGLGDAENSYRDIDIHYNVLMDTRHTAIRFYPVDDDHNPPANINLQNNIIYAGDNGAALDLGNPNAWTITHNNWPNGVPTQATGIQNFSAPPQFSNPTNPPVNPLGFQLQSGSSSIDAGTPVTTPTDWWGNYRNNPPSLGIHEFNPIPFDNFIYLPLVLRLESMRQP